MKPDDIRLGRTKQPNEQTLTITGLVQWDDTGKAVKSAVVTIHSLNSAEPVAKAQTDEKGRYSTQSGMEWRCQLELYAAIFDRAGKLLTSTKANPVRVIGPKIELNVAIPALQRRDPDRIEKPMMKVGPFLLDARAVDKAEPEVVLDIARAFVDPKVAKEVDARISAISPDLNPRTYTKRTLCGTSVLTTVNALIAMKKWPREIGLRFDDILTLRGYGYTSATYDCPDFTINYFTDGPAAVDPDTSSQDVIDPGLATVLTTLPAGSPPTYVKRVCYWLERALNKYISPPFNLRNPAGGGKIPVYVNTNPYGSADHGAFYINNSLNADLLAAVVVHELFHMVQFQYAGSGSWYESMLEGGAVWAEDANTEMMNRYLDEAGVNFNGAGVQAQPQMSLETAVYKASLFWRYVSEQRSGIVTALDEPLPIGLSNYGADIYKPLIEACSAGTWSTDDIKAGIQSLPYYGAFYEFGYLDLARDDLTSSETTLGNYVLACYLKDLDENVPDRRFDFMEAQETIYMDEVIGEAPQPGDKLPSVTLAGSGGLAAGGSLAFTNSVSTFASRFYEVNIDPAVVSIQVQLTTTGLSSSIFQIAVIDEDNRVRDIYRTDKSGYTKQFANLFAGKRLNKIVMVVTGAAGSGTFSLAVNAVPASSDVMVTRWNSALATEYEIDSRNWSWTWISPDVWVDNDLDGIADSDVFFNQDNKLFIRLHNLGNADASGIGVEFYYQDASGGLSPSAWLPVRDNGGSAQTLTGLSIPAGTTNQWSVNWSPAPSGASHHFCVRAIVTAPGDPNTDNKRVLSNFGNVHVKVGGYVDISIIRRNIDSELVKETKLAIVPRLTPDLEISLRDLLNQQNRKLQPGETAQDIIRILHRPTPEATVAVPHPKLTEHHISRVPTLQYAPDPLGNYPLDPKTLPPGVAKRPMITFVHLARGVPTGGVTIMVTVDK